MLFFLASPSLQSLNFSNNFWIENTFEIILMFKLKTNGSSKKSQPTYDKNFLCLSQGKNRSQLLQILSYFKLLGKQKKTFQSRL